MDLQDEHEIQAYFLGELTDKEALEIERRCFDDEDFAEKVFIVEGELIEDYLDEALTSDQREHFINNYLTTTARRSRLELVQNLRSHRLAVTNQTARKVGTFQQSEISYSAFSILWQRFRTPARLGLAFAVISLLLAFCAGLFRLSTHPEPATSEQTTNTTSEINASSSPSTINVPNNLQNVEAFASTPNQKDKSINRPLRNEPSNNTAAHSSDSSLKPETKDNSKDSAVVAFTLLPGALRDNESREQSIKLASDTKFVDLRIETDANVANQIRAELQTAEGETILKQPNLTVYGKSNKKRTVSWRLPAEKLKERTYVVVLYENNEPINEYVFKVKSKLAKDE